MIDTSISQVFNADNRQVFVQMEDNSIDAIITDPPYKDYQSNRPTVRGKVAKIDSSDFDIPFFLKQSARVLKQGSHFYCWCDHLTFPSFVNEINILRDKKICEKSSDYLTYKNCLIWVKNNHGSGDLRGNYAPQHEMIIFAIKGNKGRPLLGKRIPNVLFKRTERGIKFYPKVSNYAFQHGTSKPLEILDILISKSTSESEVILDPYAGSMSTAISCIKQRRIYIMIEKDREHYEVGMRRIKEHQK